MPSGPRTNSSSFSTQRNRLSAWLMADWLSPSRSPARVALFSSTRASNTRSRLRSRLAICTEFMLGNPNFHLHHAASQDRTAGLLNEQAIGAFHVEFH